MARLIVAVVALLASAGTLCANESAKPTPERLSIYPAEVALAGPESGQQVVVTAHYGDGREVDVTAQVEWESDVGNAVEVSPDGRLTPAGNGSGTLHATWQGLSATVAVAVRAFEQQPPINFADDIVPIFTKLGCNVGGCHGKASGQNGFKLSLLGFEPAFDYDALVKQVRGRRVFPADPDRSLLLAKATGQVPHGGGKRMDRDSDAYHLLRRWIAEGTPPGSRSDPTVESISVWPTQRRLDPNGRQQVIVTAHYSDGSQEDVTHLTEYQSNDDESVAVDEHGVVASLGRPGETAVMARHQSKFAVFRAAVPNLEGLTQRWDFPTNNFIDEYTSAKWRDLGLVPSELCDDAVFLRRAMIDICGSIPTADEVREFVADSDPQKRDKLVDRLVDSNEYADYFGLIWADVLHNKRQRIELYRYGTYRFHEWIRQQMLHNRPYNEFVRDILGAQGNVEVFPPAVYHRLVRGVDQHVENTSQLFLGLQLSCAQCHHHPFERWSQDDYWGMAAFFGRIGRKFEEKVFDFPPRSEWLYAERDGSGGRRRGRRNRRGAQPLLPKPLDGPSMQIGPDEDPRHRLVDWMIAPDNPFFARALVNRYWKHFFGVGIVDPEDDMRVSNPPSDPELLDRMAREFVQSGFDLKQLVRTITKSRTYQLASEPNEYNREDRRNYAHFYPKRLKAEVLLDAISRVTGVPTDFKLARTGRAYGRLNAGKLPLGTRAIQLPDESVPSYFLDVFGRPPRSTACQCERIDQPSLAQSLTLMNSDEVQEKVHNPQSTIATLAADPRPDPEKLNELFLSVHARPPSAEEQQFLLAYLEDHRGDRAAAFANIVWSLLSSEEFQLNY